jgi:cell division protein FtsA
MLLEAYRKLSAKLKKFLGAPIKKAFLSVSGLGLPARLLRARLLFLAGDSEITDLDVKKVLEASENELPSSFAMNRKVIHSIPISYKIDGRTVLGRPQGMKGMKLESRTLFITCLEQHLNDLIQTLGDAGIEVEDVMAGPLAASLLHFQKLKKSPAAFLQTSVQKQFRLLCLKIIFRFHLKYFRSVRRCHSRHRTWFKNFA